MKVFVYGSNEAGIHGTGSAKQALKYGAIRGRTRRNGGSYGISTKRTPYERLPLERIARHVAEFLDHARQCPGDVFHVVEIGCGRAGYTPEQIAPLFRGYPANVRLPGRFVHVLMKSEASSTAPEEDTQRGTERQAHDMEPSRPR